MRKLLLLFALTVLPLAVNANDSGTIGENVSWYFDESSHTITFSGTGGIEIWGLTDRTPWYKYKDAIEKLVIEDGITYIGWNSFCGYASLKEVSIPNSVTSISGGAFIGCSSLTELNIPNNVTDFGQSVFENCTSLTSVNLPDGITIIPYKLFYNCSSLTEIIIPDGVTEICEQAFYCCNNLNSINIPDGVTSIGRLAFGNCSSLTKIGLPNSMTSIGEFAFYWCHGLVHINIPDNVTSIGEYAFYECGALNSISIGKSVTTIGENAFDYYDYGKSYLSIVYCRAEDVPEMGNDIFGYVDLEDVTLIVPQGCKEKYQALAPWNTFGAILEDGETFDLFPDCWGGELRKAALYLHDKGIVNGEHGMLLPNREASRAELAKTTFYGVYAGYDAVPETIPSDNYPSVYDDLQDGDSYYYRAAKALLYLEYGDGVAPFDRDRLAYEPSEKISRIHVLKVLLEAFNLLYYYSGDDDPFPNDPDVASLAANNPQKMRYLRIAACCGIVNTKNRLFRPYDYCTRGEAFLMLYRIMQYLVIDNPYYDIPGNDDYFQPLNTTMKTVSLGAGLQLGNFQHYTKTCFTLDGVVPMSFLHTYNSYNTTLPATFFGARTRNNVEMTYQPMGDGWSHNYHSFITVVGDWEGVGGSKDLRAIVHWGGGNIHVYKSENGKIVPESMGVYDDFVLEGKEVVITSKSQVKYRFAKEDGEGAAVLYLSSITDRNGNMLSIEYEDGQNGAKRIKDVTDGKRSLLFYYLDGTDMLEKVTDPLKREISFTYFMNEYTGKYQLQSFTDAEGNKTTYEYADLPYELLGKSQLLSRIQLPKGNYIENEYDKNRRLKQTVSGLDGVPTTKTSIEVYTDYDNYYGNGLTTESNVTVKQGNDKEYMYYYRYNKDNVVTEMGNPEYAVDKYYNDSDHPELPTKVSIANYAEINNIVYDEKGNVTSCQYYRPNWGSGYNIYMEYDAMNNLTKYTDGNGNITQYIYDEKGNLTEIQAPEDVTTKIKVGTHGLTDEVTNGESITTKFEYNEFGNLAKATLPVLGLSSSAEYDPASRLIKTKDALGRVTNYDYNKNDQLTTLTDPMNHVTKYAYDPNGNLTGITNAKNGVTTLTYDNATDWLLSTEFQGAKKQYGYNEDGTLKSYTKADGTRLDYTVDGLGRVTNDGYTTYTYDGPNLSSVSNQGNTFNLQYGNFGLLYGFDYKGTTVSFTYDDNNNLSSIENGDWTHDVKYTYDGLNRMIKVQFNSYNNYVEYTYRKDNQLSKVDYYNYNGHVMSTEYGYDEAGRLISKETKLSDGTVVAGYSYQLDNVGNIVEQTTEEPYGEVVLANEDAAYTYDNANRISEACGVDFSFDANGNTTKRGSEQYTWNVKDLLTKAGSTPITYDPLGNIETYGDITFATNPLGMGNVMSDSKSGAEYIYGHGLEARVINGKASYYVTDLRGSVVAIVDEEGNITHKYQYDEFGNVTQKEEADYNPFQYVGKHGVMALNDHLYYMRARHYDPTIGRFLSEDPIWSTNLYPYAENNPISMTDTSGNSSEPVQMNNNLKELDDFMGNLSFVGDNVELLKQLDLITESGLTSGLSRLTLAYDIAKGIVYVYDGDGIGVFVTAFNQIPGVSVDRDVTEFFFESVKKAVNEFFSNPTWTQKYTHTATQNKGIYKESIDRGVDALTSDPNWTKKYFLWKSNGNN